MADYAGYETFEEFHRGALSTVWKARRRGATDAQVYSVKICRPPVWDPSEAEAAASQVAGFADSVEEQRVLCERGATAWVSVLAAGRSADESYFVSRFYPRSLERVIGGRAALQSEDIQWLALSIATGLEELQRLIDRPHGNLKPGNIFIDSDGRVRGAKVLLSDIKPRRDLDVSADRAADFHALGRTIVHLARRQHTNLQGAIGWPLEAGPEWRRFGRHGAQWRNLCNLLLNPHPEEVRQEWDFIIERIRCLAVKDRRRWIGVAALAVPVLAACAGLAYLKLASYESIPRRFQPWAESLGNVPPDSVEVPLEWSQLCLAYNDWLGVIMRVAEDRAKSAEWMRQAYLRDQVFRELFDAKDRFGSVSPRDLAGVTGDLEVLRHAPPDVVKKGQIAFKIREVAHAVDRAQQAFAAWPERVKVVELAGRLEQLGWQQPAAELRRSISTEDGAGITPESINAVLTITQISGTTESLWAELERRGQVLAAAGDPVMSGVLVYLSGRAASAADLATLNRALADATQETNRWLDLVRGGPGGKPKFDRIRFAQESALREFSGPVTDDVLRQWETETADFMFVSAEEDPRQGADFWNGLFRPIDESITAIREEERAGAVGGAASPLETSREQARRRVDALLARPVVRKDIPGVAEEVRGLTSTIEGLSREAREALFRIAPRPADWLGLVRQASFGAEGSELRREWDRRRTQFIGDATAASLERNKNEFRDLRARYLTLERLFADVAGERGQGTLARLDTTGHAPAVAHSLGGWAGRRADRTVGIWLERVSWNETVPAETCDALLARPEVRTATEAHAAAMRDASRFGQDLALFDDRLARGAGSEDPAAVAVSAWRAHADFSEWKDLGGIGPVLERADTLARLEAETRIQALIEASSSPVLGLAWTAWRRLGAQSGWPGVAQIETEDRLAADMKRRVEQTVREPARLAAMQEEIQREMVRRWRVAFRGAGDDSAVGRVVDRMGSFGVRQEDLAPEERFNLELYRLKKTDWAGLSPDKMATARNDAVARVQALFGGSMPDGVATWVRRLSDLVLVTGAARTDVTRLGPGTVAGWTGETGGDDRRVEFRRAFGARSYRLAFVLVDAEPAAPFYLCTSELPVGLAMDLSLDAKVKARLKSGLGTAVYDEDGFDRRSGPQTWRMEKDGSIRPVVDWAPAALPTWPKPLYAESIPAPGAPSRAAPLQYVPASVAAYFATELLGSRLPTPEEWQAMVTTGLTRPAGGPLPNLRDGVWQRQRDYLLGRGVVGYESPVDADIFWPISLGDPKRLGESGAAVPDLDDGLLWFSDVETAGQPGIQHLLGNVAEFLFDPDTNQFMVAGGSALSPPGLDPEKAHPLAGTLALTGFSDVGIRLAFDAPAALTGRTRLLQLIRNQPYLRL